MKNLEYIKCPDYEVGVFSPVSFKPVFKWHITTSKFPDHPGKISKLIIIETTSPLGYKLRVIASPYSFGIFNTECLSIGFGEYRLDTHDPEEAVYLAELFFFQWVQNNYDFYKRFLKLR